MGVDIDQVPSAGGELLSLRGDLNTGFHGRPGMQINFTAFSTSRVTPWLVIYNGDNSPESMVRLQRDTDSTSVPGLVSWANVISNALLDVFGRIFGAGDVLENILPWNIWNELFPNCDGYVAQWNHDYPNALIMYNELVSNGGQIILDGLQFPGYNSPKGCGSNSLYTAKVRWGFLNNVIPPAEYSAALKAVTSTVVPPPVAVPAPTSSLPTPASSSSPIRSPTPASSSSPTPPTTSSPTTPVQSTTPAQAHSITSTSTSNYGLPTGVRAAFGAIAGALALGLPAIL